MKPLLASIVVAFTFAVPDLWSAQTDKPEDPAHQELRQLRDGVMAAINKGELDALLPFLHTNVVITWHNAEVSRGHAGVRAYYDRTMKGPQKIVESFTCQVVVDELTIFYDGDTGICFGSSDEHFKLATGKELIVRGRWSATLVKENSKWLVASLHASTNLFDNVILDLAKKLAWVAGVACLLGGLVIGLVIGWRRRRAA